MKSNVNDQRSTVESLTSDEFGLVLASYYCSEHFKFKSVKMADALQISDTTYSLALIREYLMSRGCSKTVRLLDAMKIKVWLFPIVSMCKSGSCTFQNLNYCNDSQGVKQVSDLYSLPAPSSKLLPPADAESSESTLFRMVSHSLCCECTSYSNTVYMTDRRPCQSLFLEKANGEEE